MLAASVGQAAAATDRPAAELAALCASCHRLDNKPHGIAPIVSLGEQQIIAMMRGFRARRPPISTMDVVSSALSNTEIVAVAGYVSRLRGETLR